MEPVLEEPKRENMIGRANEASSCRTCGAPKIARHIKHEVDNVKDVVVQKLADERIALERLRKQGQYAFEDSIGEVRHTIKRFPMRSMAIAFGVGALLSLLIPRPRAPKARQ